MSLEARLDPAGTGTSAARTDTLAVMSDTRDEVWYADQPFRWVEAIFSLDRGRAPKATGYRPVWRFTVRGREPVLAGMCEMTVIGADLVHPGSPARTRWEFVPEVQGYIEALASETGEAEVCEGLHRVGMVHNLSLVR